jgi:hypothetical protein
MINFQSYKRYIKTLVIPEGVTLSNTNFGSSFVNMPYLEYVVLPDSVSNVSFQGCKNLKTAVCPRKMPVMYGTYRNCTNLTTAVCGSNVDQM